MSNFMHTFIQPGFLIVWYPRNEHIANLRYLRCHFNISFSFTMTGLWYTNIYFETPSCKAIFPGAGCTFEARLILSLGFGQYIYRLLRDEDGGQITPLLCTLAHVHMCDFYKTYCMIHI
jgi:hypothetical protein